jgi:hypothetical protein
MEAIESWEKDIAAHPPKSVDGWAQKLRNAPQGAIMRLVGDRDDQTVFGIEQLLEGEIVDWLEGMHWVLVATATGSTEKRFDTIAQKPHRTIA